MKSLKRSFFLMVTVAWLLTRILAAQQAAPSPQTASVPHWVNFTGNIAYPQPKASIAGLTFSIYRDQNTPSPLWMETQNVQPDAKGNYTVQLGAMTSGGLPLDLFASGEARWLGVRVNGGEEQSRVLLLSVPYALKAADAQTLNGLPASAFALAAPAGSATSPGSSASSIGSPNVGGTGTQNYVPLWTDNKGDLGNSILFQTGSGSSAKVGVNEKNPILTFDVNGSELVRGLFEMATQNYANKNKAYNSQPLNFESSAFNSGTGAYTLNHFQWQAEPTGNNTSTPAATLNLLYGTDPAAPSETGLSLNSTGLFTFAPGQTFPGAGTVTSVGSGAGLAGGPITGAGTLSIAAGGVTDSMLANSSLTVTAGTDLTGGGTVSLGGTTTLNLDTTKVPQLKGANTFTGNQTVNGNLTATGVIAGSSYQIGSNIFASGAYANQNAFLGFAGNSNTSGTFNSATGWQALLNNTTGSDNVANGTEALQFNISGSNNTATGSQALQANNAGGNNTALGSLALLENTTGNNNTASGYQSLYANKTGTDNTAIGDQALRYNLTSGATAVGSTALMNNTTGFGNTATGYAASTANTTGFENTATGYAALTANTTGFNNTASGTYALQTSSAGEDNTATGAESLRYDTTGGANVADGYLALNANTTGSANVALGLAALENNTTGNYNTAVGYQALANAPGDSFATCIGYACNIPIGVYSSTAIGALSEVDEDNALVLGAVSGVNGAAGIVNIGIGTTQPSQVFTIGQYFGHALSDGWDTYSSLRWKTNVKTLPDALSKVEHLRGVSYELKSSGKHEIGVIAEEVGAVVPEIVSYERNGKDARGVDYSRLTALLIEAVKQQQKQIRELQKRSVLLEAKFRQLRRSINEPKEAKGTGVQTPKESIALLAKCFSRP